MNSSRIYFGAKPSWSGKRFSQNIPLLLQPLTIQERILWNTKYQAAFNLRGFISLQVIYLFVKTLSEKNIYIFIAYVAKFATHRTYGGKIYLHQYHHDHYQFWNLRETKFLSTTLIFYVCEEKFSWNRMNQNLWAIRGLRKSEIRINTLWFCLSLMSFQVWCRDLLTVDGSPKGLNQ